MTTNLGTKIAINWLCANYSDYAIAYGGGFEWSARRMHYCRYPTPKGRCYGNHFFGFLYMGCTLAPPGEYD